MMKKLLILATALALAACGDKPENVANSNPADLVFLGGSVYVADNNKTVHQAIAISNGEIVSTGSTEQMSDLIGESTQVVNLDGRMVLPGLHDMHVHALGTVAPDACDLDTTSYSLEDLVPVLRACMEKYRPAPGEWLIVGQWAFSGGNQPSERYPTIRAALDAVSGDTPIMLMGDDGHHSAVNSAALTQAKDEEGTLIGLSKTTLESHFEAYKELVAVGADGEPTGGISETARDLLSTSAMNATVGAGQDPAALMPRVAAMMAKTGITSFHDPWVTEDMLVSYKWLADNAGVTFRARLGMIEVPKESWKPESVEQIPAIVGRLKAMQKGWENHPYIQVNGIKLFADAVLEGNPFTEPPSLPVAAVLNGFHEPIFSYDEQSHKLEVTGYREQDERPMGILEHHEDFIRAYIRAVTDAGLHPHVHALSDRAVRVVADEFEKTKAKADALGLNQSVAHLQLAHPDDVAKLGKLGVSTAMTYVWAGPAMEYDLTVIPFIEKVDNAEDMYDADSYYMQNVYPVRTLMDSGANLVWGSDAPVESRDPRPFLNMAMSISRAAEGRVLNAGEVIDIHESIRSFTINGARMMGTDKLVGTLEKGKRADLIVIDRNVVELAASAEPEAIADTRVLMTVFDGQVTFDEISD